MNAGLPDTGRQGWRRLGNPLPVLVISYVVLALYGARDGAGPPRDAIITLTAFYGALAVAVLGQHAGLSGEGPISLLVGVSFALCVALALGGGFAGAWLMLTIYRREVRLLTGAKPFALRFQALLQIEQQSYLGVRS